MPDIPTPSQRHAEMEDDGDDVLALTSWNTPNMDCTLTRRTVTTSPPAEATVNLIEMYLSAYQTHDRVTMELILAAQFSYTSPAHRRLDRPGYFRHCWPASPHAAVHVERIFEKANEAFVTYQCELPNGTRFRNTAFFILQDGRIRHLHIYSDSPQDLLPVECV